MGARVMLWKTLTGVTVALGLREDIVKVQNLGGMLHVRLMSTCCEMGDVVRMFGGCCEDVWGML